MGRLVFVRHGHSVANAARVFANRGDGHALTGEGRTQAATLADRLAHSEVRAIWTSPLLRARQTAEILAAATRSPVSVHDGLRECDIGELEGTGDAAGWALHATVNAAWACGELDRRPPGGESLREVRDRLALTVALAVRLSSSTVAAESDRTSTASTNPDDSSRGTGRSGTPRSSGSDPSRRNGAIILVGHGSLLMSALPLVLSGLDPRIGERWPLGYVDTVVAEDGRCVRWAGHDPATL